jgi:hypothetical protein
MVITPYVPVSWGELIDKITVLEIKSDRLQGDASHFSAAKELGMLNVIAAPVLQGQALEVATLLKTVNEARWEIEGNIRDRDRAGVFDAEFIELTRAVYKCNELRGELMEALNQLLGLNLLEEKSYRPH